MIRKPTLSQLKSHIATTFNLPILYKRTTYSQEGEDLLLEKLFHSVKNGFYVDVGAHHPFKFSNTQLLYEKGWRGINIEPTPGRIELFEKVRKKDINIAAAISEKSQKLPFFLFNDPALNTFDSNRAHIISNSHQSMLKKTTKIKTQRLDKILNNYLPQNQHINLLNIDVEGFELQVLKSNNWKRYQPHVILVEYFHYLPPISYLRKYEYVPFAQTYSTQFFKKRT